MKRLCDVPDCSCEAREEVADGWMCRKHAVAWDRANDRNNVAPPELFIEVGSEADDDVVFAEGHSRWLGANRGRP